MITDFLLRFPSKSAAEQFGIASGFASANEDGEVQVEKRRKFREARKAHYEMKEAMEKAKESYKKERLLAKQREEKNLINIELIILDI